MIGYPVVMKVISQQVVHKTDAGGVILNIRSPAEATAAFETISRNVREKIPGAVIDGIIVVQQLTPGLELIIGGKTDPTFGKVITIGAGGTLVELLRDVSIRVLPVDEYEIRTMVRELRSYRLIEGYRNQAPRDEEAFVSAIAAAARWFFSNPRVVEFDLNPLVLYEKGGCAVDARVYVDDAPAPAVTGRKSGPSGPDPHHPVHCRGRGFAGPEQGRVRDHAKPSFVSGVASIRSTRRQQEILGRKAYPSLSQFRKTWMWRLSRSRQTVSRRS